MRVLVFGNSGSGKTVHAQRLAAAFGLAHLDLDTIVWVPGRGTELAPAAAVESKLRRFIDEHPRWIVEGCYGELIEAAAPFCTELVFLNPGLETCLENNRRRPWEPHKYATAEEQRAMLAPLLEWVRGYYRRDDAWSYARHRRLFDGHRGTKKEWMVLPPR